MKEQIITFETAKLAKEKGFLIHSIDTFYQFDGSMSLCNSLSIRANDIKDINKPECYAPHQAFLQKWLREVHRINIFMTFKPNIKKWDFIPYSMDMNAKEYIKYNYEYSKQNNERRFDTYEEALEIGLQEALKLI